jgi:hypothetical protein
VLSRLCCATTIPSRLIELMLQRLVFVRQCLPKKHPLRIPRSQSVLKKAGSYLTDRGAQFAAALELLRSGPFKSLSFLWHCHERDAEDGFTEFLQSLDRPQDAVRWLTAYHSKLGRYSSAHPAKAIHCSALCQALGTDLQEQPLHHCAFGRSSPQVPLCKDRFHRECMVGSQNVGPITMTHFSDPDHLFCQDHLPPDCELVRSERGQVYHAHGDQWALKRDGTGAGPHVVPDDCRDGECPKECGPVCVVYNQHALTLPGRLAASDMLGTSCPLCPSDRRYHFKCVMATAI